MGSIYNEIQNRGRNQEGIKMHLKAVPVILLALTSCQATQTHDPSSLTFRIPEGSTLALNKDLDIPAGSTHALLQSGKSISKSDRNQYNINCRFETRTFGPRTIKPEVFRIRRTEDGQRQISDAGIWLFFSEIHLESDKGTDVIMLRCQTWGSRMDRNFTVTEMKPTLGDYFTFTFPQTESSQVR